MHVCVTVSSSWTVRSECQLKWEVKYSDRILLRVCMRIIGRFPGRTLPQGRIPDWQFSDGHFIEDNSPTFAGLTFLQPEISQTGISLTTLRFFFFLLCFCQIRVGLKNTKSFHWYFLLFSNMVYCVDLYYLK